MSRERSIGSAGLMFSSIVLLGVCLWWWLQQLITHLLKLCLERFNIDTSVIRKVHRWAQLKFALQGELLGLKFRILSQKAIKLFLVCRNIELRFTIRAWRISSRFLGHALRPFGVRVWQPPNRY